MEIRQRTRTIATTARLVHDPDRGYVYETDRREETVFYGVEVIGGEDVIVTGEYARKKDVPKVAEFDPVEEIRARRGALDAEIERLEGRRA